MNLITNREPSYSSSRTRQTIDFCEIPRNAKVLDIAAPNDLSKQLATELRVDVVNTTSDLDYEIKPAGKYEFVTCFEVIEHLLNPRLFFDNLHKNTTDDVIVYLSYPSRPKLFWNNEEHFHEYDRLRFDYLLEKTGFKIVDEKSIYVKRKPKGIRPVLRNFIPQTRIYKIIKK